MSERDDKFMEDFRREEAAAALPPPAIIATAHYRNGDQTATATGTFTGGTPIGEIVVWARDAHGMFMWRHRDADQIVITLDKAYEWKMPTPSE